VADLAFVVLPLHAKLRIGLPAFAKIFVQLTDQITTVERRTTSSFGRSIAARAVGAGYVDKPVCYIATGLLQESLKWVSGGSEFRVNESKCVAVGDEICEFVIQKEPIS
jgi:predicted hydrocarbon binding protein